MRIRDSRLSGYLHPNGRAPSDLTIRLKHSNVVPAQARFCGRVGPAELDRLALGLGRISELKVFNDIDARQWGRAMDADGDFWLGLHAAFEGDFVSHHRITH